MKNLYLTILINLSHFLFGQGQLFAQNTTIDSIIFSLKTQKQDSNYIKKLIEISRQYTLLNNYSDAKKFGQKAIKNAELINDKKGILNAYTNYGFILRNLSNYDSALLFFRHGFMLCDSLKDKKELALIEHISGDVYNSMGNYKDALFSVFKALKLYEKTNNTLEVAHCYNTIGGIYLGLNKTNKSLEYYLKSLKISEELKNKKMANISYFNIGSIYQQKKNYEKALSCYSTLLDEKLVDKFTFAVVLNNIGNIYTNQKKYDKAISNFEKAITIQKEIGDKKGVLDCYTNLAVVYDNQKNTNETQKYLNKALGLAIEIGDKQSIANAYIGLSDLNEKKTNYKLALTYRKLFSTIKDTLFNTESNKQIIEMNTKYESEKKDKEIIIKDAEIALQQIRTEKQAVIRNSLIIGFIVLLGIIIFIYRGYLQKQKVKLDQIEKEKLKAELTLLKNQISPHVMFNLVNVIYIQIEKNKDLAREMMLKFSELLRYQLYECGVDFIEIEKEIDYLKKFIDIQQIRKSNRCTIEVTLSEEVKGFLIAPLLFIPVVENAFKYVTNDKNSENYINISLTKNKNELCFNVKNTCYVEQERVDYGGIGLVNLKNRLQLIYPAKHSFKFSKENNVFYSNLIIYV